MRLNPHTIKFLLLSVPLLTCGCTTDTTSKYIDEISDKSTEIHIIERDSDKKTIEAKVNNKKTAESIICAFKSHSDFSIGKVNFKLKSKNEWWLYRVEMNDICIGDACIAPIEPEPSVRIFTEIHPPARRD